MLAPHLFFMSKQRYCRRCSSIRRHCHHPGSHGEQSALQHSSGVLVTPYATFPRGESTAESLDHQARDTLRKELEGKPGRMPVTEEGRRQEEAAEAAEHSGPRSSKNMQKKRRAGLGPRVSQSSTSCREVGIRWGQRAGASLEKPQVGQDRSPLSYVVVVCSL